MPARRRGTAALARALVVLPLTLALPLALAACAPPGPSPNEIDLADEGMKHGAAAARGLITIALDEVEIGRSIGDDRTIQDEADSFQHGDTIYASIRVSGAANSGLVRAMWSDERGRLVQDDTRIVSPSRGDLVALQLSKPQELAGGRYRLDVFLDNKPAGTKTFSVEGPRAGEAGAGTGAATPTNH